MIRKKDTFQVFFLSFFTGILCFIVYLIRRSGFLTLCSDFNLQQVSFTMALHNVLQEGNPAGWIWNYDLGCSIVQGFSFYELGSPFFWLTTLFPVRLVPYLMGWIYVLKYTVAAMTAYCWLARFTESRYGPVIGALMYAFSGFQAVNLMFYHFHDVVALFPLLLAGIDRMQENPKNRGLFVFAVFINCLVNFFFFVQNVLFCILYYIVRFRTGRWKDLIPGVRRCILCGLWGVAMAAVLFIPNVLYITHSSRTGFMLTSPVLWPRYLLYVLRGLLFPAEPMNDQSSFYVMDWKSVGAWLPVTGYSLCIPYLLKKRKDRLRRLLIILLIITASPLLSSVFYLLSEWYYRWWYMLVLMAALASVRVMEHPEEYDVRKGLLWSAAAVAVLYLIARFIPGFIEDSTMVYHPDRLLLFALIALAGIGVTTLLYRMKKMNSRRMIACVCAFSALTTATVLYYYGLEEDQDHNRRSILLGSQLETIDDQYRYLEGNNIRNMTGQAAGTSIFSSTVSSGSKEFDALFDYDESNLSQDKSFIPGLPELLGARYEIFDSGDTSGLPAIRTVSAEGVTWVVTEREACPIGFAVDRYILKDNLLTLPSELRGIALLQAAAIDRDDRDRVAACCTEIISDDVQPARISDLVARNVSRAVLDFDRDSHGFRCRTEYAADTPVWFSVPYDTGWHASVDGKETAVIDSGGMILIVVPAGSHRIEFTYVTPGWTAGKWISLAAALAFLGYGLFRILGKCRPVRTAAEQKQAEFCHP